MQNTFCTEQNSIRVLGEKCKSSQFYQFLKSKTQIEGLLNRLKPIIWAFSCVYDKLIVHFQTNYNFYYKMNYKNSFFHLQNYRSLDFGALRYSSKPAGMFIFQANVVITFSSSSFT